MKQKYIFLLRFLGLSLVLFIFRQPILNAYTSVLLFFLNLLNSNYHVHSGLGGFIYSSSMTILAFVALILAMSIISTGKRARFLILGVIMFLVIDYLGVQYMIFPQGRPPLDEDSFLCEFYLSSKWILPFLLWIIMSYADIQALFSAKKVSESSLDNEAVGH